MCISYSISDITFCRLEPGCKGLTWDAALDTIAGWRHTSFRCVQFALNLVLFFYQDSPDEFFCCLDAYECFQRRKYGTPDRSAQRLSSSNFTLCPTLPQYGTPGPSKVERFSLEAQTLLKDVLRFDMSGVQVRQTL